MRAEKEIIVALEFGTSAIRGIAGIKKADSTVQVMAIEEERTPDAIQRGVIYNIDKTTQAINNIVAKLEERTSTRIARAYVGVAGQSLHTEENPISRKLATTVKITPELIDNLKDNNRNTPYPASQVLDVIPQEYIVGNHSVVDPIGIQTEQIEARFLNVVAKNILLDNIHKCMHMADLEIVDLYISPLTLADVLLSDNEKRSGCAMIDFGAGTTTVAVYIGNLLRHLAVIPLGGRNITNDIATCQQVDFEEAEALKRKHGVAYVAADSENPMKLAISNDRTMSENDLQNIIGPRQEEIIANVWHQIEPMSERLLAGIIITGGAAQMKDMPEAIKHFTKFSKVKPAKSLITTVEVNTGVSPAQGSSAETLIALLMRAEENCAVEEEEPVAEPVIAPVQQPVPPVVEEVKLEEKKEPEAKVDNPVSPYEDEEKKHKKSGNNWKRFTKIWNDLFTEDEEDE